jgi:hypothetical protein
MARKDAAMIKDEFEWELAKNNVMLEALKAENKLLREQVADLQEECKERADSERALLEWNDRLTKELDAIHDKIG